MGSEAEFHERVKERERALVGWWTRGSDPVMRVIDSLDIGWAGAARWAASSISLEHAGIHLDICCGWGSFLAHLGWRYPSLSLVGLNIDFEGPHANASELLRRAGVQDRCELVRGDARRLPFPDGIFDSASCFLGLQDVLIGFGEGGIRDTVLEARRIVRSGGQIVCIDDLEMTALCLDRRINDLELRTDERFEPDVRWDRAVGERAIEAFARGRVAQMRLEDPSEEERSYRVELERGMEDLERQLNERGHYNPLKSMRLLVFRKR
jgi:SAM-dependent methyltransferase